MSIPCTTIVPHLYGKLFGENDDAEWLCQTLLNLDCRRRADMGRFRDAFLCSGGSELVVYTRNGDGKTHKPGYDDKQSGTCECPGCVTTNRLVTHPLYNRQSGDGDYLSLVFKVPDAYVDVCRRAFVKEPESVNTKFEQFTDWVTWDADRSTNDPRVTEFIASVHAKMKGQVVGGLFDADFFSDAALQDKTPVVTRQKQGPRQQCPVCYQTPVDKCCSRCRHEWYCSVNCQTRHWTQHKPLCKTPTMMPRAKRPVFAHTVPLSTWLTIESVVDALSTRLTKLTGLLPTLIQLVLQDYLHFSSSVKIVDRPSWSESDGSFPFAAFPSNTFAESMGHPFSALVCVSTLGCRRVPNSDKVERLCVAAGATLLRGCEWFAKTGQNPMTVNEPRRIPLPSTVPSAAVRAVTDALAFEPAPADTVYACKLLILETAPLEGSLNVRHPTVGDLYKRPWEYDDLVNRVPRPQEPYVITKRQYETSQLLSVTTVTTYQHVSSPPRPLDSMESIISYWYLGASHDLDAFTAPRWSDREKQLWMASFAPSCKLVVIPPDEFLVRAATSLVHGINLVYPLVHAIHNRWACETHQRFDQVCYEMMHFNRLFAESPNRRIFVGVCPTETESVTITQLWFGPAHSTAFQPLRSHLRVMLQCSKAPQLSPDLLPVVSIHSL